MFGLLVELGPLILNENSVATPEFKKSGVPTLYRNDFRVVEARRRSCSTGRRP